MKHAVVFLKSPQAWISATLALTLTWALAARRSASYFEISLGASASSVAQLFYDVGRGMNVADSVRVPIRGGGRPARYRFPVPAGNYRALRLDPTEQDGSRVALSDARIVDLAGRTTRAFPPASFHPAQQIALQEANAREAVFVTSRGNDPILYVELGTPIIVRSSARATIGAGIRDFLAAFLSLLALGTLVRLLAARRSDAIDWAQRRPRQALLTVAAASAILSCYPIVFFGKSFVSPNVLGAAMLYAQAPSLPGSADSETEDSRGSDYGAMLWQNLPYSFVQSRALWRDGELPLWDRFNSSGVTLLGQGLSMFGDPLHLIVLAAGGAAWAWDLKFLLAKALFCWAIGLASLSASRHLPSALALTVSSAFLGFFSYRMVHPAFFSFCYAPWLLLAWLEITRAKTSRATAGWAAVLALASWTELNSGTAKEAYMLLASMHGGGLLIFLLASESGSRRWKFPHLLCAGASFALIAAPVWLTFFDALARSYTAYNETPAWQIQPGLLLGLFDDLFYDRLNPAGGVFDPSANFFVLLGCLLVLARFRALLRDPLVAALGLNAVAAGALAFGVVPPSWINHVPVLRNVGHLDNTFSCALIIFLTVLAGFGFRIGWQRLRRLDWLWDLLGAALGFGALAASYLGLTQARQRPPDAFEPLSGGGVFGTFGVFYVVSLVLALFALPLLGRLWQRRRDIAPWAAALATLCFVALHWRFGMHLKTGIAPIDDAVVNPQRRVNLSAHSPAIGYLQSHAGAWRTVGFDGTFFAGYNALSGLESIYGTDPLINPYYRELLQDGGVTLIWTWRWLVEKPNLQETLPLYNLLGVRYFLDPPEASAQAVSPSLELIRRLDLNIYENHAAWPRAFFAEQVSTYDTPAQFIAAVRANSGQPFAAVQRGDAEAATQTQDITGPAANPAPARDYRLTSNTTAFTVDASGPGVAVLTEAYLAGDFAARLNGAPVPYFRVNHAFRGVRLPRAGTYHISFSYWPRHFTMSLWMFAAGCALLAGWAFAMRRTHA